MPKSTSPTNSGKPCPTDLPILKHVALYGLTFTHPVQRLFFPVEQFDSVAEARQRAGDALHALSLEGLLSCKDRKQALRFHRDQKYYILTRRGAKLIGSKYSKPAANPNKDLAILWACVMGSRRFHRVTNDEMERLLPNDTPSHVVQHIVGEQEFGAGKSTCVLYRVYSTGAEAKAIANYVRKYYTESCSNESLRPMVEVGDYGFAILVPTEERRGEVQKQLAKPRGDQAPLNKLARFTVRLGPTHATLRQAIEDLDSQTS